MALLMLKRLTASWKFSVLFLPLYVTMRVNQSSNLNPDIERSQAPELDVDMLVATT